MFSTTPWFLKGNFSKDSVIVIKTQKSHHKTKFLIICNNPRIASTKTQSIFCNKNVFCERQDSEKTNISWYQIRDIWVFLKQKSVSKTLNLWKQHKGHEISKNCQERGDRSLISHPSLLKIRVKNVLKLEPELSFNRFYIWYLKLTSRFKTRTLKLAFSKFQPWPNTKVKKTYKSKVYTCNKALKHLPQILFCLLTTPYSHGNVVVQKKGY